ncbi:lasso peptide biosynthesis B2 protein [Peristeroidobacter soli]|uniref:lasso peptide biosynthesis B2 protein n=1 Tax=Peristeroidobacter soli TaxID=2497877 RepID=UPI00101D8261|nr:lasso peptide biosynthesis B2 protein [Peristeroidobacter soli]
MDEYLLPAHVHFCRRGDAFVFLDLKQDDYTLINGEAATALRAQLSTQAADSTARRTSASPLDELLKGGLLTTNSSAGRRLAITQTELATEQLLEPGAVSGVRVTFTDFRRFFTACTLAAVRLKWGRLENTIAAVARRKARHSPGARLDVARARELTAIFYKLRTYFPFNYLCLFDSLALVEFLARYRIFPTWVFGVKLEPWVAHCWIQQGTFAFNEGVEEAAGYTPIMVV